MLKELGELRAALWKVNTQRWMAPKRRGTSQTSQKLKAVPNWRTPLSGTTGNAQTRQTPGEAGRRLETGTSVEAGMRATNGRRAKKMIIGNLGTTAGAERAAAEHERDAIGSRTTADLISGDSGHGASRLRDQNRSSSCRSQHRMSRRHRKNHVKVVRLQAVAVAVKAP